MTDDTNSTPTVKDSRIIYRHMCRRDGNGSELAHKRDRCRLT